MDKMTVKSGKCAVRKQALATCFAIQKNRLRHNCKRQKKGATLLEPRLEISKNHAIGNGINIWTIGVLHSSPLPVGFRPARRRAPATFLPSGGSRLPFPDRPSPGSRAVSALVPDHPPEEAGFRRFAAPFPGQL